MDRLAGEFDPELGARLRQAADDREKQAKTIRELLKDPPAFEIG